MSPLVFYMSALGQILSGGRLIGEVAFILLGYLGSYFIIFYLTEKITGNFLVSLGLLTMALTMLPRFYKYYIVLGPAVFVLSLYYYFYYDHKSRGVVFLALSSGLIMFFRLDFGAYAMVISVISIYFNGRKGGISRIAQH